MVVVVSVAGVMGGGRGDCRGGQDGGGTGGTVWGWAAVATGTSVTHEREGDGRWKRCQAIETKSTAWGKALAVLGAGDRIH